MDSVLKGVINMIIKEIITNPNTNKLQGKIYSNKDYYIQKDNILYTEVIGNENIDIHDYTETLIPIPDKIISANEFYQEIIGVLREITKSELQIGLETIKEFLRTFPSNQIYKISFLCPEWRPNTNYIIGDKIYYNHSLYEAISPSEGLSFPDEDNAFKLIERPQELIEEWSNIYNKIYKKGEKVKIGTHIYTSLMNNNIWSPVDFPAAWQLEESQE